MEPGYEESVLAWRQGKEESLRAEEGWLSLAGLFWLAEGEHLVGSRPDCPIRLPTGAAPDLAGAFILRGEEVIFRAAPGVRALSGGSPLDQAVLAPDTAGAPTKISVGNVTMALIRRGARLAIRVWDRSSAARASHPGREWFPVQAAFRFEARFVTSGAPRLLRIVSVLGDVDEVTSPGRAVFTHGDRELGLYASEVDDEGLFFIFHDATSGKTTYPAGRYLYTPPPEGGRVVLDFNRAYNPPCAFTPYATCPLPPEENFLPLAIAAGERYGREGPTR